MNISKINISLKPVKSNQNRGAIPLIDIFRVKLHWRTMLFHAFHTFRVSDMKHVIERLQQSVTYEKKNMINVDRQNVLMGAIIGFKRTSFNEWQKLDVKFSGESGIDDGGPSREFMRLCIRAIQNCSIFEGPSTQRQIALDYCGKACFKEIC